MRMMDVGRLREIVRYPIKSMAGVAAESALLGAHGLPGDRRYAFRRKRVLLGMPWLTASRLPELLLYQPVRFDDASGEPLPTHVRSPSGAHLELQSEELRAELAGRFRGGVELVRLDQGIFDETPVSIISLATIAGIGREAGLELDPRRFRANFVLDTEQTKPFHEDGWVGHTLLFGEADPPPAVRVTKCDLRCVMINLDPDTAAQDARVMKTATRLNRNNAGVYATVVQTGTIRVGDRVRLADLA
ncbi:MAG TPA: MOSC domain-containing protein [Verrucomicrobiae bacterium]|nr:MOSC domain-containing protein [Verrucomicrobiae bacterium]